MPRKPSGRARSEILHVRLSEAERVRLRRAAQREYLDESTYARRAILQALDHADAAPGDRPDARPASAAAEEPPGR